jgi:hypothetical protein
VLERTTRVDWSRSTVVQRGSPDASGAKPGIVRPVICLSNRTPTVAAVV